MAQRLSHHKQECGELLTPSSSSKVYTNIISPIALAKGLYFAFIVLDHETIAYVCAL